MQNIKKKITFYKALSKDKETPFVAKLIIITAIAYLLSPVDLIPDFIPVLGHVDDLLIVPLLLWLALVLIPEETKLRVSIDQNR